MTVNFRRHPHPASVHFPIAFLALTCGLDLLQTFNEVSGIAGESSFATPQEIGKAAHYTQALGLITAIPALATGFASSLKSVSAQGLWDGQTGQLKPKMRVLLIHGAVTMLAMLGHLAIWYSRERAISASSFLGRINVQTVAFEAALTALMFVGAALGGQLAFNFGMGMSSGQKKRK